MVRNMGTFSEPHGRPSKSQYYVHSYVFGKNLHASNILSFRTYDPREKHCRDIGGFPIVHSSILLSMAKSCHQL